MSWVLARSAGARPFEINTSNKRPQQTEDGGGRKTSGHVPLCSLLLSSPLVSALATGNRVQVRAHDTQWWRSVVVFARMPPAVEGT